ncbi:MULTISPECIES: AAA family ATPase [unclassified Candidatus Frackibacter]|uniref:AAA family ATPase n=1 Tax=unclassified Candidatus Frackibacter TaxID=2648818 RepID=UPI000883A21A|nr:MULTISPECIES: AAA family ATPase [unclassified Candidatus Frackibacter]SDB96944.1 ATP-dependent metalloprotease FtsH [Candidatus Frackibacter sp. WG11]SEM28510.1 ATP-dependent metalloprotease FtsH [Candidatus Frackibacter sp. WG12]SFL33399.1 ATP-dependent metalloprotease FtsH [Candidatus Frackibacter sp. WG13]
MVKELSLGIGLALVIFLAFQGINVAPIFFFGILGYVLFEVVGKQGIGNNKSFNTYSGKKDDVPEVKFEDIGGQDTAKNELLEALEFVKDVRTVKELGIRPLKGIMLSGPPGTGKTLMAKAAARYIDSVFISTSGSEFIEMYAGVGAKRVRELFKKAKDQAKKANKSNAVIFIDEIDILGGKRGQHSSHLEYDQTLNQLLVELDGMSIDDDVNVLVVGATNRIDILDEALLRPGRFDRIVKVDLPDKDGRKKILEIHTNNKPLAEEVDLNKIARETFRFSGAHLENLANEAAIMAMREESTKVMAKHFKEAIDKVMMGEKLNRRPKDEELKRVAYHETGHALIAEKVKPGSVSTITITSRGKALGYVRHNPEDDFYLQTLDYLEGQIAVCIAGAITEEIILGNRSTGAANDFEKATKLAKKIIFSGMSELGIVSKDDLPKQKVHEEINKIIEAEERRVEEIITNNQDFMTEVVEELLDKESIEGEDFRRKLGIKAGEEAA